MYDVNISHSLTVASAGRLGFLVPVVRSLTGHAAGHLVVGHPFSAPHIPLVRPPKRLPNRHCRALHGEEGGGV